VFWADRHAHAIIKRFGKRTNPLIIRDEKTASGRVHIGSMRGVAIHGTMASVVENTKFLFEINDFDPMDSIPAELDVNVWQEHLGKPLNAVPSPDGSSKNFAEYYADEFKGVIADTGYSPTYSLASDLYKDGKMNEVIRIALDAAQAIRKIYKDVSRSEKAEEWLPISMICEKCSKIGTTQGYTWDGKKVSYRCTEGPGGAKGCGHEGVREPWDGKAKLPWKVEWPAKWKVVGVDIEGAGKDHSTKGGAREIADTIAKEVFHIESPYDIPYEFFLDKDGKKMSSSKGRGVSSREIAENFPPILLRLALIGKEPQVQTSLDPSSELLALLYDWHDRIAEKHWSGVGDDEARLFEILYFGKPPGKMYYPRFSTVVFIAQMPHLDINEEFGVLKGASLTNEEKKELSVRIEYTKRWLASYAPKKYRFILATDTVPEGVKNFSNTQKDALKQILAYVEANESLGGATFHAKLHEIKESMGIAPKDLFSALYVSFLGRDSGPQAGWFLSTLDREFLIRRLREVL